MSYPYLPPPSGSDWLWNVAQFLAHFCYDVEITISRGNQMSQTVTVKGWTKEPLYPT